MPKLRIYLVDDNTLFLVAASRFLRDFCGAAVIGAAQSAEKALAHIAELRPDVVLIDLNMPGMSGLDAAARIKSEPDAPAVLIVTLNVASHLRDEAVKAGCDGLVSKIDFSSEMPPLIEALIAKRRGAGRGLESKALRCDDA